MQLNRAIIEAAIVGFERQKEGINKLIAELRAQLDGGSGSKTEVAQATTPAKARRRMSAAGRKRIAEAQRKRWALQKEDVPARKAASPKNIAAAKKAAPKRKLSAAARTRLVENLKKARAAKAAKKAA
jgi:hypothetical protein